MTDASALTALRAGGKVALARALAEIEGGGRAGLLDAAAADPRGIVLGITGPPGAGKSTLIHSLVTLWRQRGRTVGVVAVDPSSQATGGALLGDRARMRTDPEDGGVFLRSMAARDRLGGLSDHAVAATVLMRAVFDRVIVETVGAGQSEGDVATVADTLVLLLQPGAGDALQFMKSGIMELPDLIAIGKADLGGAAESTRADVTGALSVQGGAMPVMPISARTGAGIEALLAAVEARQPLPERRAGQPRLWVRDALRRDFGRTGLAAVDIDAALAASGGAFAAIRRLPEFFAAGFRP